MATQKGVQKRYEELKKEKRKKQKEIERKIIALKDLVVVIEYPYIMSVERKCRKVIGVVEDVLLRQKTFSAGRKKGMMKGSQLEIKVGEKYVIKELFNTFRIDIGEQVVLHLTGSGEFEYVVGLQILRDFIPIFSVIFWEDNDNRSYYFK